MKHFLPLLIISVCLNACLLMPPGAPHGHGMKLAEGPDTLIHMGVGCYPHNKRYVVLGAAADDSVYIRSSKLGKTFRHCRLSEHHGRAQLSYNLRIGDMGYHRKLSHDTVLVKIVRRDSAEKNYRFVMMEGRK